DATASKKKILFVSTYICVIATACMAFAGPGCVWQSMALFIVANVAFGTGEDLIAAFLPEISSVEQMGRISAIGWAAGYIGCILNLGGSVLYIKYAMSQGLRATQYVPNILLFCAAFFAVIVIPTFLFLKERAVADPEARKHNPVVVGFQRLRTTLTHAVHYRDLFNFLITLFLYSCGTTTVIHLASVYAQKVLNFTQADSVMIILVVSLTAALGSWIFGSIQDKIGSVRTLRITLAIWTLAILVANLAQTKWQFCISAVLVGIAMGSTGSVGRAVVAQFSPEGRSGEFLGLWGMAVKLATGLGAITFGVITFLTHENYRLALSSMFVFFFLGILMLSRVDEKRGRLAARTDIEDPLEFGIAEGAGEAANLQDV
ncbi:MAG TPA: MFS transporter, partial [Chroococcales cyanobacterium]